MHDHEVVIVGNGVAGYAAADRLARHGMGSVLVGPGPVADRPPLTKAALAAGEPVLLGNPLKMAERSIERLDGWVADADLGQRTLVVRCAEEEVVLRAQTLVLALGLSYEPPPIPGLEYAELNATPEGLTSLSRRLAGGPRRVLIVGGGLIGTETAATLASAGHQVTVVDIEARPLHRVHDPVPALAASTLETLGVVFLGEFRLEAVERRSDGTYTVHGVDRTPLAADVVIAATGGRQRPLPGLADHTGPVAVEAGMRVPGHEGVFAVGDCAAPVHERFGRLTFPHWDVAMGTGSLAADAIAGVGEAYTRLPYWWSDIGPRRIGEVGVADAVSEWAAEDGLHVGRDTSDEIVCVMVVDAPRRMRDARALLA